MKETNERKSDIHGMGWDGKGKGKKAEGAEGWEGRDGMRQTISFHFISFHFIYYFTGYEKKAVTKRNRH